MTIFLTGGAGKTSRRLAAELAALSPTTPILTSSRSAPQVPDPSSSTPQARFDWFDSDTYANPFTHPAVQTGSPISAIYLVLPASDNPLPEVQAFVRVALEHHSSDKPLTLVLLSSDTIEPATDSPAPHGRVHAYLQSLSTSTPKTTAYAVLRPSFFMENFSEAPSHVSSIKQFSTIRSATGAGRESFISADDIAAVAARCLLGTVELDRDYVINGPEYLTYGDVARTVGGVVGREVTHTDLTTEELAEAYVKVGLPQEYAEMLAALDGRIREGMGREPTGVVERVTGRKGITFAEVAERSKSAWM